MNKQFDNMLNPDCECCEDTPPPTCAETKVIVRNAITKQAATGVTLEIYYEKDPYLNPGTSTPSLVFVASGSPDGDGLWNAGVLPTFSYFGRYRLFLIDVENNWRVSVAPIYVGRCQVPPTILWYCKSTVIVETEPDCIVPDPVGYPGSNPQNITNFGIKIRDFVYVRYNLQVGNANTTPGTPQVWTVSTSAGKDGTLGNCEQFQISSCNDQHTSSLPQFHYRDQYVWPGDLYRYEGTFAAPAGCSLGGDGGCFQYGAGPAHRGVLNKTLIATFTPYYYGAGWISDDRTLGSHRGQAITIKHNEDLHIWESEDLGANGNFTTYYNPYGGEIKVPFTHARVWLDFNNFRRPSPSLFYYEYWADPPGSGTPPHYQIQLDGLTECTPTDLELTFLDQDTGQYLTYMTLQE